MFSKIRTTLKELKGNSSGNAMLIMAMSMPALVGGAGLAVDTAQWYLWKRELQFAVDQAAIAGAWAKANSDSTTQATWSTRAQNEFTANADKVSDIVTTKTICLSADTTSGCNTANPNSGTTVLVTASAAERLPFTAMLIDKTVTVSVKARARWNSSQDFHTCLLALAPSASKAFEFGGSVSGSSTCGAGALSNDTSSNGAMKKLGNNSTPLGELVSEGKIDSGFSSNGTIYQNQSGLSNPYSSLTLPSSSGQTSRTYPSTCPVATPASTAYYANGSTKTHYTYAYYKGANSNNWTAQTNYTSTGYIAPSWSTAISFTQKSVRSTTTTGVQTESTPAAGTAVKVSGNGNSAIWRLPYTSTQDTITAISSVYTPAVDGTVHLSPGIYSSLVMNCKTNLSAGVYFVSGNLDFGTGQQITGTGVMFEMTGAATATLGMNDASNVNLTGITASTLTATYGLDSDDAAKIEGMLVYDPNSTSSIKVNGNSQLKLSGVLYMPKRDVTFNGNGGSTETGVCMMVAANTLKLTGNFSLTNFCSPTGGSGMSIGGTAGTVELIE